MSTSRRQQRGLKGRSPSETRSINPLLKPIRKRKAHSRGKRPRNSKRNRRRHGERLWRQEEAPLLWPI